MSKFNNKFSLLKVYRQSLLLYTTNKVDNKLKRMNIDVKNCKIVTRTNLEYNRTTRRWHQTGQNVKIVTQVNSIPKSYNKIDTINTHKYNVIFLIENVKLGLHSPFKWREGSESAVVFPKNYSKNELIKTANSNITKGRQMQFFFEMEYIAKINNLLYGKCYAKWYPRKTNPKGYVYFGKHGMFVMSNIIIPLLQSGKLA